MNPVAVRVDHVARPLEDGLVILAPNHRVHHLDAVAAWVWERADGRRSVAELHAELRRELRPNADQELVFEALDRLADAELLARRVSPPSGVSRRVMLRRLVGGAAAVALAATVGMPEDVLAATGGVCGDDKALIAELAWLEAEEVAVAEVLDGWLQEATVATVEAPLAQAEPAPTKQTATLDSETKTATLDGATKTTTTAAIESFYLTALSAKERQRKQRSLDLREARADASDDLAACKLAKKTAKKKSPAAAHTEQMQKRRKKTLAKQQALIEKRSEQATKRTQQTLARLRKHEQRVKQVARDRLKRAKGAQESASKKLAASNGNGTQAAALAKVLQRRKAQESKRKQSSEQRIKASKTRLEEATAGVQTREKAQLARAEMRQKALAKRHERQRKQQPARFLRVEKRTAYRAEEFSGKQLAKASKDAGVQDRALELAQQDAMEAMLLARKREQQVKSAASTEQKRKQQQSATLPSGGAAATPVDSAATLSGTVG